LGKGISQCDVFTVRDQSTGLNVKIRDLVFGDWSLDVQFVLPPFKNTAD
jgi:hypothetical protein